MNDPLNLTLHFPYLHFKYFSENLSGLSEEQIEKFYKDLQEIEEKYQDVWSGHMLADMLVFKETPQTNIK